MPNKRLPLAGIVPNDQSAHELEIRAFINKRTMMRFHDVSIPYKILPTTVGYLPELRFASIPLPISGVFEIVRLCDIFQPQAPELHQLADVEIVMRDPAGEHLARADGAVRSCIGFLPIWIL